MAHVFNRSDEPTIHDVAPGPTQLAPPLIGK